MDLNQVTSVYLVGIGGIGMSALARYFNSRGCMVAGYDRTETALTGELVGENISVTFEDKVDLVLEELVRDPSSLLLIYTPSVPQDSVIMNWLNERRLNVYKRSEVLGMISRTLSVLAVAGTHGKTTTCTLLAHLIKSSGEDITAFLGGISSNYHTNFLSGTSKWVVVEADEYDRSFLTLYPHAAAITSMDEDHLDIYGGAAALKDAYDQFAAQVWPGGLLLARAGLPLTRDYVSYSAAADLDARSQANITAENVHIVDGVYRFDYESREINLGGLSVFIPGRHNVENALAAITLAMYAGVDGEHIRQGLSSFKGVKRRFELIYSDRRSVYIDDYAHHPAELAALLNTARELFPERKLSVIFQPHLYTRTRDLHAGLANALNLADRVVLMEIYPAREEPIEGVTSKLILDLISLNEKSLLSDSEILLEVSRSVEGLWVTAGAGDIDRLVEPLANLFSTWKEAANEVH